MDPTQIRFKAGQPIHFITTRPFALGNTGITVHKGTDVMFDGTKADVDGSEYILPQLRGAIKAGWLVIAGNFDENAEVLRPSANIQVRHPTQGGNPMQPRAAMPTAVSEEEREVGNTRSHAAQTRTANNGYVRGQTKVNMANGIQAGQMVKTQRGMMVVEDQDGTVVDRAPLQTVTGERAKQSRVSADSASQVEASLAKVKIEPVAGVTRDELLERMSEEEGAEYMARISAQKAQYVDEAPVVGRVKSAATSQQDGITLRNSVGGGTAISDPTGLGGKATQTYVEQEGIRFAVTNGAKRDMQTSQHPRNAPEPVYAAPVAQASAASVAMAPEVRLRIAKAVCPEFPDTYDFGMPEKKRLARIQADFEDRPDVIKAIFQAETDDFRAKLVVEFPAIFA